MARNAVTDPAGGDRARAGRAVCLCRQAGRDGRAASRSPIGYQTDKLAVVTKGLTGGENVVVDGQSRLQAGTKVAVATAPNAS